MKNPGPAPNGAPSLRGPTTPELKWSEHLAQWRRSGLEGSEFCRRQSLSYASFRFWKKEILLRERRRAALAGGKKIPIGKNSHRKSPSHQAFIPVRVKPAPPPASGSFEVLVGSRVVRVPPDFDPDAFQKLMAALERMGTVQELRPC
jgi:hypothetical protein